MSLFKMSIKTLKIVGNVAGAAAVFTGAGATDLGNLKGKPFAKVTWDQNSVASQLGAQPLDLSAKFETSTLEVDSTTATALQALRGTNCSLQATPFGTVSATNPILLIKDFTLLMSGEINVGDSSFIKLHGEKPAAEESDFYSLVTASA
jgi:hypothetical protein